MARLFDVARFIIDRTGEVSPMKLQKLMYYSQAWHLVWEERALFAEDFQAWANGPVVRALYERHRGQYLVDASFFQDGDATRVAATEAAAIEKVLAFYGGKSAHWLSNLTHAEAPWLNARGDTPIGAPSEAVITKPDMAEYYDSL